MDKQKVNTTSSMNSKGYSSSSHYRINPVAEKSEQVLRTRQNKPKSLPIWAHQSDSRNPQILSNMKGTEHFTRTIAEYLNQRAMADPLFAPNLLKPNKNIEECITYILNEVQKSGCNGFDDDEIFSMAVHYYDEDNIEVGKAVSCQVAVNHIVELTEEEKAEARQEAIKQYQSEELAKLQSRNARVKKTENIATQVQPSLFDF